MRISNLCTYKLYNIFHLHLGLLNMEVALSFSHPFFILLGPVFSGLTVFLLALFIIATI